MIVYWCFLFSSFSLLYAEYILSVCVSSALLLTCWLFNRMICCFSYSSIYPLFHYYYPFSSYLNLRTSFLWRKYVLENSEEMFFFRNQVRIMFFSLFLSTIFPSSLFPRMSFLTAKINITNINPERTQKKQQIYTMSGILWSLYLHFITNRVILMNISLV